MLKNAKIYAGRREGMSTKARLRTTLDRLPFGDEGAPIELKVNNKLPEGVKSGEIGRASCRERV